MRLATPLRRLRLAQALAYGVLALGLLAQLHGVTGAAIVRRAAGIPDSAPGPRGLRQRGQRVALARARRDGRPRAARLCRGRRGADVRQPARDAHHRRLARHADLPRFGQGHRRLSADGAGNAVDRSGADVSQASHDDDSRARQRRVRIRDHRRVRARGARSGSTLSGSTRWTRSTTCSGPAPMRSPAGSEVLRSTGSGRSCEALFAWPGKADQPRTARMAGRGARLRDPSGDERRGTATAAISPSSAARRRRWRSRRLAAVGTVAGIRYWAAGLTGSGGLGRGRGAGAHARRRAVDRPVAVAVPALRPISPTRPAERCWAAAACSTTPLGCSRWRSRPPSPSTSSRS